MQELRSHNRWQFSLRALMLAVLLCSVALALWTTWVEPFRAEHRAIEALRPQIGKTRFVSVGPSWLRSIAGDDFFRHVVELRLHVRPGSVGLDRLGVFRRLERLDCSGTDLRDTDLARLPVLPRLEELRLGRTRISDAGLRAVARLPRLTVLDLGVNRVTPGGLAHLEGHPELETLGLAYLNISERGLASLQKIPSLRRLTIQPYFAFLDERLDATEALKRLEEALPECRITVIRNRRDVEELASDIADEPAAISAYIGADSQ